MTVTNWYKNLFKLIRDFWSRSVRSFSRLDYYSFRVESLREGEGPLSTANNSFYIPIFKAPASLQSNSRKSFWHRSIRKQQFESLFVPKSGESPRYELAAKINSFTSSLAFCWFREFNLFNGGERWIKLKMYKLHSIWLHRWLTSPDISLLWNHFAGESHNHKWRNPYQGFR